MLFSCMNNYNPFSLEGKVILVTGASSGIGRSTAVECSRLGAKLIITARNEVRLTETLGMLEGTEHQMILADLTDTDELTKLVEGIPQIDGFVCNAGINKRRPIGSIKEEVMRDIFETNLFACIHLTKAIMKSKKLNRNGSMVFVSSMAARQVTTGNSVYAASKAAIESFSRSCALEYSSKGIRSNAVLPGMVETPLVSNGMLSEEDIERDKAKYMLKRYGKPEEIAWAIIYLLSDASAWTTSTSIKVMGGGEL